MVFITAANTKLEHILETLFDLKCYQRFRKINLPDFSSVLTKNDLENHIITDYTSVYVLKKNLLLAMWTILEIFNENNRWGFSLKKIVFGNKPNMFYSPKILCILKKKKHDQAYTVISNFPLSLKKTTNLFYMLCLTD